MKTKPMRRLSWTTTWLTVGLGILAFVVEGKLEAVERYVDVNSASPSPPYTSWATAARDIQSAIDVANPGDDVIVTNGVYQTGGRLVIGAVTNRVAVTKPLRVRSVNGPDVTMIRGYQVPGITNGEDAVRCVYLTNGARLVGFTLLGGATRRAGGAAETSGGGVWSASASAVVSNCVLSGNSAYSGGGAQAGTLSDCTFSNNIASFGGGASLSTLHHCTLAGNFAEFSGGGVNRSTLHRCTLTGNSSGNVGGGASEGTLNDCTLTGNWADSGGGMVSSTLNNCLVTDNSAIYGPGGGADYGMLNNCVLTGNTAYRDGGGAAHSTLNNCTLSGNSATSGGGAFGGDLNNCIVYYNFARESGANYADGTFNSSCTTPLPASGTGNISAEPQLASAAHLSAGSPCRGAGKAAYATGVDIDGESWATSPSIGCDELRAPTATGPLNVGFVASFTNVANGFAVRFTAQISGHASVSRWDFGDGTVVSNRPYATHTWVRPGDYAVVLWAYNESAPSGVSVTGTVHVVEEAVHYVAAGSVNPLAPFGSWATAASNIQDAVDVAPAGALILVSNGVYQSGGKVVVEPTTNRVAVTKPLTLQSVNGPTVTVIQGYQLPSRTNGEGAVRCVYLAEGAALVGFTLTNGATSLTNTATRGDRYQSGGGVWCASGSVVVSNCVFRGNSANGGGGGAYLGTLNGCTFIGNSAHNGGGAYLGTLNNCTFESNAANWGAGAASATLNNCTLTSNSASRGGATYYGTLNNSILSGNSARYFGGGALGSTLNNCTVTGNSAQYGGGTYDGALNNCIVYHNVAHSNGPNYYGGTFHYSCTTPLSTSVVNDGNFTNAPLFLDPDRGNLRLQSESPCINSGFNGFAPAGPDLDGNPRVVGGTVDVGAYEFQSPQSLIAYVWLQQYGLPIDDSTDRADPDGDQFDNRKEWLAGTNPTNALSVLRLLTPKLRGSDLILTWESVPGRRYFLEWSATPGATPSFQPLIRNYLALGSATTFTHTNAVGLGPSLYRVGVEDR